VPVLAMFTNVLKAVVGYALAAAAAFATLLLPTGEHIWSALLVGAAAWLLALGVVTAVWPAFRRDVRTIVSVVRTFRAGRGRVSPTPQQAPDEDVPASVV
jgi:PST family polysaccharide transporter